MSKIFTESRHILLALLAVVLIAGCGSSEGTEEKQVATIPNQERISPPEGWIQSATINLDELSLSKPVFVYFWTTWCKGCKQTEKWYFENQEVREYLIKNYHLVKINGDSTKITINGKEYGRSKENELKHELNLEFSPRWKGYPNILLFDKELNFISPFEPQIYMGWPADKFLTKLDSVLVI